MHFVLESLGDNEVSMHLLIMIPALNEEETIESVLRSIPRQIDGIDRIDTVVIDDGSTDKTAGVAEKAGAAVLSHSHNLGVGRAFQTGLEEAIRRNCDIVVNIDADGQFRAQDIPLVIAPILRGQADMVVGNRFGSAGHRRPPNMPLLKYHGNQLMTWFINGLTKQKFPDVSSGFRAINKTALYMLNPGGAYTYTQEMFLDLSFKDLRITSVPVDVTYFPGRTSRVANSLGRYAYNSMKIIIRAFRDYRPMPFFLFLSYPSLVIGITCGVFMITYRITQGDYTPYKIVGLAGIYFLSLSIFLLVTGFVADMFVRVRLNQEKLLYLLKSRNVVTNEDVLSSPKDAKAEPFVMMK